LAVGGASIRFIRRNDCAAGVGEGLVQRPRGFALFAAGGCARTEVAPRAANSAKPAGSVERGSGCASLSGTRRLPLRFGTSGLGVRPRAGRGL
jgi:hypothetical protein